MWSDSIYLENEWSDHVMKFDAHRESASVYNEKSERSVVHVNEKLCVYTKRQRVVEIGKCPVDIRKPPSSWFFFHVKSHVSASRLSLAKTAWLSVETSSWTIYAEDKKKIKTTHDPSDISSDNRKEEKQHKTHSSAVSAHPPRRWE